jgi:rhodanese-related sulfurtransferase
MSRERFIEIVTADQPDTPAYFTYDAVLNAREHSTLKETLVRGIQPLSLERVCELMDDGAQLLDTREPADFEGAHMRGAINVGLGGSYATWAGTLLDHKQPIVLVAEPGREVEAATRLGRIGFDTVAGYLADGMEPLDEAPELIERTPRLTAGSLAEQLASPNPPLVIDVRSPPELEHGRIADAINVPLSKLPQDLETLPEDRPLVVYCGSGYRSAIAASLLRRHGRTDVFDLVGGLAAWESTALAATP